jgi:plastocyanin
MRSAALLAALVLAVAGCGVDDNGNDSQASPAAPHHTVTITETDFALDPSSVALDQPGTYAFEVVNEGQVAHALEIEGQGIEEETETLDPGERATLTVDLSPGTYELYCPIDDHAERGMNGRVDVRASGSPPPTETTDESDDGY